jgi:cytochrome oxidase Cu insertion factor (SCO1/SenC/PrrC family)/thiol-disulfide isomerase/thioredoxin
MTTGGLHAAGWLRRAAWPLLGAVALGVAILRPGLGTSAPGPDPAVEQGTALGGVPAPDFRLTDQFGHSLALADDRGQVVVLAFIDSRCTTQCPLTAQMLRDAKTLLGSAAGEVQLLAVNANPDATAVADVRTWSDQHGMTDAWHFLTGPAAELAGIWQAYHVGVEVASDGEVTHTDAVYVIDSRGRERYLFTTTPDFAGIAAEAHSLAERIAALLPGGVKVAPVAALGAAQDAAPPSPGGSFTLPALTPAGGTTTVGAGRGRGAALVAFFATWCQACREDLQVLGRYAAEAGSGGLPPVVGVDLRSAEPSTPWVQAFVRGAGVSFPVGLDGTGRVADAYGVTALPYLALVSADGRVLWRHVGVLPLATLVADVRAATAPGR